MKSPYSALLAMVVESMAVDMYSSRAWPPARWLFFEHELSGLLAGEKKYKYRFLIINGSTILIWVVLALVF
jgi:hypothetical protein